jgi:methylase of polypeptide subunit release factors
MSEIPVDQTLTEWDEACATNDRERWLEHLERVPVCDFFPVLAEREALTDGAKLLTLSQWLNHISARNPEEVSAEAHASQVPHVRLASATYLRWRETIQRLLNTSRLPNLPTGGVVQYFTDHLAATVLIRYKRIGSTIDLSPVVLALPNPVAYLDPLRMLPLATTQAQQDLLRRSLYSRHKVVIQRNTLIHIDRERAQDVFGPSIDTLFLNDWLHANRYARQRTDENAHFFEDPVPRHATATSLDKGVSFLDAGCGNGLLTASFAKNEAMIRSFTAIDISHAAISATYDNVATQRQLHGHPISSRGRFIIGRYGFDAIPGPSELVVCNPPYIPEVPVQRKPAVRHPLGPATVGTDLLKQVLTDSPRLITMSGELFLISSTLAEPEIIEAIPAGMSWDRIVSRSVPFDIEALRGDGEEEHLRWLQQERGLTLRDDTFHHDIAIYRITCRAPSTTGSHQ